MYNAICDCVTRLKKDQDIRVVIPCGPAVQMARGTAISGEKELTRDGFHMDYKYGRYLTACVWFETLIQPCTGKSVKGNSFRNAGTENEVTDKEAKLMQKVAIKAVKAQAKR